MSNDYIKTYLSLYKNDKEFYNKILVEISAIILADIDNLRKLYCKENLKTATYGRWETEKVNIIITKSQMSEMELKYLFVLENIIFYHFEAKMTFNKFLDKYEVESRETKCYLSRDAIANTITRIIHDDVISYINAHKDEK